MRLQVIWRPFGQRKIGNFRKNLTTKISWISHFYILEDRTAGACQPGQLGLKSQPDSSDWTGREDRIARIAARS
jgi:hypothetical protein